MNTTREQFDAFEIILIAAEIKGEYLRFPERYILKPDIQGRVHLGIERMDSAGISFRAQNQVLQYVNNIDVQKVWEKLKGTYLTTLIEEVTV